MDELTAADVVLLALLTECEDDYQRAYDLSRGFGHDHEALYRALLKVQPPEKLARGHFPLLIGPDDWAGLAEGDADSDDAWGGPYDTRKMIRLLQSRGLPDEYAAILERDRLRSIDAANQ